MSRRRRHKNRPDAGIISTANHRLFRSLPTRRLAHSSPAFDLRPVEDRRTYHPETIFRPARTVWGGPVASNVVSRPTPVRPLRLPTRVAFRVPRSTVICVRRHARKEVLFAKNIAGRGRGGFKKPHFNFFSEISCRRK